EKAGSIGAPRYPIRTEKTAIPPNLPVALAVPLRCLLREVHAFGDTCLNDLGLSHFRPEGYDSRCPRNVHLLDPEPDFVLLPEDGLERVPSSQSHPYMKAVQGASSTESRQQLIDRGELHIRSLQEERAGIITSLQSLLEQK